MLIAIICLFTGFTLGFFTAALPKRLRNALEKQIMILDA